MNKVIIGVFIGTVALIGSLIMFSESTSIQSSQKVESKLSSSEKIYDFGSISMAKGNVSREFVIANNSNEPVTLKKISTSCMCTTAKFKIGMQTYGTFGMPGHGISALTETNIVMTPGTSGVLEVTYDPNAHGPAGVGPVDRFVYLEDLSRGELVLEIKAVVTP